MQILVLFSLIQKEQVRDYRYVDLLGIHLNWTIKKKCFLLSQLRIRNVFLLRDKAFLLSGHIPGSFILVSVKSKHTQISCLNGSLSEIKCLHMCLMFNI